MTHLVDAHRVSAWQFGYTFGGRRYDHPRSLSDPELSGPLDEAVLPSMMFLGSGAPPCALPVRGLSADVPPVDINGVAEERLDRARGRDQHSVADLVRTSADFTALLGDVIARRVQQHGFRHIGVLTSGGLDSGLLVHVCAGLKRAGVVEEVTAFHWTWPDVPEVASETSTARATCAHSGVAMHETPGRLVFGDVSRYQASTFPFPGHNVFEYQFAESAESARRLGVDVLLHGVASELSTATESSKLAEIERLAVGSTDADPVREWPIGEDMKPEHIPSWISEAATAMHVVHNSPPVSAAAALRLAFDHSYRHYCTGLAQKDLCYVRMGPELPVTYAPYMELDVLKFGARLPSFMHLLRCGGEVYSKALIRVALRDLPRAVFLRSGGSPYNAIEEYFLRNDWAAVVDFWRAPSHLADLGLIDIDAIRASLDQPATLLSATTTLCPVMLVEDWLRLHPDQSPAGKASAR